MPCGGHGMNDHPGAGRRCAASSALEGLARQEGKLWRPTTILAGRVLVLPLPHHPEEDSDIDTRVLVSVELGQRHGGFE